MQEKVRLRSDRFARELARRKLSQNAWAEKFGVSKAYLSQLINGHREYPGGQLRRRILQVLNVQEKELFERVDTAPIELNQRIEKPAEIAGQIRDPLLDVRWAGLRLRVETEPRSKVGEIMEQSLANLKHAFRALRRSPGFSLVAILTLALAIGVNTTLFSTISAVLLQDPAFPDPQRVVRIWSSDPTEGWFRGSLAPPNFVDLRRDNRTFQQMGVFNQRNGNLTGGVRPLSIAYSWVTPGLLQALSVQPQLGRLFSEEENGLGSDGVAIISHRLWASLFGEDPAVLGSTLSLDSQQLFIVGVMPGGFDFPDRNTDLWKPFGISLSDETNRGSSFVLGLGRLREGVSLEQAQQDVEQLSDALAAAFPDENKNRRFFLETLHEAEVRDVRRALMTLWGAVGMILLIACVNVANLMLVRAARRRQEFSVRSVLGASPGQVVRQLLMECLVLASLSTTFGLFLGMVGNRLLHWLAAEQLPRVDQIQFDWRVGLFTIALTLLTTLLFGLVPALHASRLKLTDALRDRSQALSSPAWLRSGLVVTQVALALILLTGAGLLIRSFQTLMNVDLGFDSTGLVTFRVEPPMPNLEEQPDMESTLLVFTRERGRAGRMMADLLQRLGSLPGVTGATAINRMPLTGNMWQTSVMVEGREYASRQERHPATNRNVLPGYFRTMGIPLLRGRPFNESDRGDQPTAVIINRAMAEAYWPDSNPLGDIITNTESPPSDKFRMTVVGVVDNVRHIGMEADPIPVMYLPMEQSFFGYFGNWGMDVLLRTQGEIPGLRAQVEGLVQSLDPDLPISSFRSMEEVIGEGIAERRFTLALLGCFAILALILAFVGIYGVISYLAAQRRAEFGIRTALGARPGNLLRQVLGQSLRMTALGIAGGLLGSFLLSGYVAPLLYEVLPFDLRTLLTVCLLMLLAGTGAGLVPAWRSSRVDVNRVLRSS